jgi:CHAP domain
MPINEIIQKLKQYEGQNIDIDSAYGHQCFDWSVFCARLISGNSSFYPLCSNTEGVVDWSNHQDSKNYWHRDGWMWEYNDPNNPDQVPPIGSIFVEDATSWNQYGHTGLIIEVFAGQDKLTTMEQNIGNGDGEGNDDRTQIRSRDYSRMAGWFYFPDFYKSETIINPNPMPDINFDNLNQAEIAALNQNDRINLANYLRDRNVEIVDLKNKNQGLSAQNFGLVQENQKNLDLIKELRITGTTVPVTQSVTESPKASDIANVEVKNQLEEKKGLTPLIGFIKNQIPTIVIALSYFGYQLQPDQVSGIIGIVLTFITLVNSYFLEIQNRK